jgi:hypothetical protein
MRSPRAVGPDNVAFELVHARTIVLHHRSRCVPCVSFQGEDTYMPAGNISGDIRRVAKRVHVPELCSRLS